MNLSLQKYSAVLLIADSSLLYNNSKFPDFKAQAYLDKALAYIGLKEPKEAMLNLMIAKKINDSNGLKFYTANGEVELDYGFAKYYASLKNDKEEAIYLTSAYEKSVQVKAIRLQLKYLRELALFYVAQKNAKKSSYFTQKYFDLADDLDTQQSTFKVAQFENEEKEMAQRASIDDLKNREALQTATIKRNNTILWGSFISIVLITFSLFFVYRQYRINKNNLLSLRKTQHQLIISEKMASLGELTAGIAHEIQNPLNFVNNFSEVNTELIDEMQLEIRSGNGDKAITLSNDIRANQEKILMHGKRADSIVKGMLQHSRTSTGKKEITDINKLTDEYLRLSYHGLRAKEKDFNAGMKTDFDLSVGNINVISQDIGRVLLNIFNNAFYAVAEKKKQYPEGYEPIVIISTKKLGSQVEIRVKDNGNGITKKVMDKIFQPFFTTKPTGQGTGLGLSLSYDIVKAHGGEIKVDTKEGEFTEFIITLPA